MVDVAFQPDRVAATGAKRKPSNLQRALKRKSTTAFLMTLPLILLISILVVYPAFYSLHLASLNKSMERFVGLGNFEWLSNPDMALYAVALTVVAALTASFARRHAHVTAEVLSLLENYYYPGNVRELENIIERAVVIAATDDAVERTVSEIGGSAPFAELMAMRHETADIRLFVT